MEEKNTTLIVILVAIIAIVITIVAYYFKDGFDLPDKAGDIKEKVFVIKGLNVKFSLNTSVDNESLSINYYVPCSTVKQRAHLLKNLTVIKNGIIMEVSRPEMKSAIQKRNFNLIRERSLKIINRYSIKDVDEVFLDYFSLLSLD